MQLSELVRGQPGDVLSWLVYVDDESGAATRSLAWRSDVDGSPEAVRFVAAFDRARLLVRGRGAVSTFVIEVVHEAFLREWPLLVGWMAERADDLRLLRRTETFALEWNGRGSRAHCLWPKERLAVVC